MINWSRDLAIMGGKRANSLYRGAEKRGGYQGIWNRLWVSFGLERTAHCCLSVLFLFLFYLSYMVFLLSRGF